MSLGLWEESKSVAINMSLGINIVLKLPTAGGQRTAGA